MPRAPWSSFVCMELVLQSGVRCEEVFHKAFHKVFHKVLQGIVGSGVRKGGGHTDLRRSVKVPASSACNLHEENQLFENKLNDVPASCSLVSKGLYPLLSSAESRSLEDAKLTSKLCMLFTPSR